ncbi:MAG: Ldh family oxidoreductase [Peptococcaceae bacterium]
MTNKFRFHYKELFDFSENILVNSGVPEKHAEIVVKVLIQADLEGISSHGLTRLPVYLERIEKGLINTNPRIALDFPFPALGVLDADNSLGHVAAHTAMEELIIKAKEYGIAGIGIRNSNHFGAASYYANMAMQHNLVGIVLSNGPPAIPPWGSYEPYLGTNPIAVSIPGGDEYGPLVIDLATSIVARGRIIKAALEGLPLEPGWALDSKGKPTTNAGAALQGCILPMAQHKGAALAMAVEILAGLLTGAGYGKDVIWQMSDLPLPGNVGHLLISFNPEGFLNIPVIKAKMDSMMKEMKSLPKAYGFTEIRIPGEKGRKMAESNKQKGIILSRELVEKFAHLAVKLSVPLPKSMI